jgi:hypothetical protein
LTSPAAATELPKRAETSFPSRITTPVVEAMFAEPL